MYSIFVNNNSDAIYTTVQCCFRTGFYAMKLIIFVQLFYRDYERSRDFRGGGGEPVSLPSASGTSAG